MTHEEEVLLALEDVQQHEPLPIRRDARRAQGARAIQELCRGPGTFRDGIERDRDGIGCPGRRAKDDARSVRGEARLLGAGHACGDRFGRAAGTPVASSIAMRQMFIEPPRSLEKYR